MELFPLIRKVNEDHDAIEIVSRYGNAALVSAEDYAALREGAYLLSLKGHIAARVQRHARSSREKPGINGTSRHNCGPVARYARKVREPHPR